MERPTYSELAAEAERLGLSGWDAMSYEELATAIRAYVDATGPHPSARRPSELGPGVFGGLLRGQDQNPDGYTVRNTERTNDRNTDQRPSRLPRLERAKGILDRLISTVRTWSEPPPNPSAPPPEPPIRTLTMARLLVEQNHLEEALKIYDELERAGPVSAAVAEERDLTQLRILANEIQAPKAGVQLRTFASQLQTHLVDVITWNLSSTHVEQDERPATDLVLQTTRVIGGKAQNDRVRGQGMAGRHLIFRRTTESPVFVAALGQERNGKFVALGQDHLKAT